MLPISAKPIAVRNSHAPNPAAILARRDDLQMQWIHAAPDTTEMVEHHPIGDWAFQERPDKPVGLVLLLGARWPVNFAITSMVGAARPEPAAGLGIDPDPGGDLRRKHRLGEYSS